MKPNHGNETLKERRKRRARAKISGTTERPRLSVFRSSRHIHAQLIDDTKGVTIAMASSFEKGSHRNANITVCEEVGKVLAERGLKKKVTKVVFDKGGNKYHGRVKALADGARSAGLIF